MTSFRWWLLLAGIPVAEVRQDPQGRVQRLAPALVGNLAEGAQSVRQVAPRAGGSPGGLRLLLPDGPVGEGPQGVVEDGHDGAQVVRAEEAGDLPDLAQPPGLRRRGLLRRAGIKARLELAQAPVYARHPAPPLCSPAARSRASSLSSSSSLSLALRSISMSRTRVLSIWLTATALARSTRPASTSAV